MRYSNLYDEAENLVKYFNYQSSKRWGAKKEFDYGKE